MRAAETVRKNAFHGDGAVVVDGISGGLIASGWFVNDISNGGSAGGARTRSAKAIAAQAGGCYVVKVSEDSTGCLVLHLGKHTITFEGRVCLDVQNENLRAPPKTHSDIVQKQSSNAHGLFSQSVNLSTNVL